ncbi:hypothetical protein CDL15_Pgr010546 [Punica granatum]|nr:hypothetical protein CDL15_Pgr010546 [Punica granatum]
MISITPPRTLATHQEGAGPKNKTGSMTEQLLAHVVSESLQFLYAHNIVRQSKSEPPLTWDYNLEKYARWWAGQRRHDCELIHSFPEGEFTLGENIFWGGGSAWTPGDAVKLWVSEEKYYDYNSNTCEEGQVCGHYTQIVWKDTRKLGCARVVCDNRDVFITCNYYPPGNYEGDRPY